MTRLQAEEEAVRRAKIDALNRAFGNTLLEYSTTILTENDEHFFSNGFNLVKGEWLETIGKPQITAQLQGNEVFLTVKIKGTARDKRTADVDLSVRLLRNGTTANCEAKEFRNGDKLYVQFTSPREGYVSVYQHDPVSDQVYCLLPYRKEGAGSVHVEHDRKYIFFSKAHSAQPKLVDEYKLLSNSMGETNTIYIMFSPNMFSKPSTTGNDRHTPRNMPFADFEAWKARSMTQDASMQVVMKNIVINK